MIAVLMASLAPSISNALSVRSNVYLLTEICSASGTKTHLVKMAHQHGSDDAAKHFEHCPFCLTHADAFGLPPSDSAYMPLPAGALRAPALFYQSARPLFAWSAAQPRAPPVSS